MNHPQKANPIEQTDRLFLIKILINLMSFHNQAENRKQMTRLSDQIYFLAQESFEPAYGRVKLHKKGVFSNIRQASCSYANSGV